MKRKKKLAIRDRNRCKRLRAEGKPIYRKERDTMRDAKGKKNERNNRAKLEVNDVYRNTPA